MALITDVTKCYAHKPGNMETDKRNWLNCMNQVGDNSLDKIQHGENPNIGLYKTDVEKIHHDKKEFTLPRSRVNVNSKIKGSVTLNEQTLQKVEQLTNSIADVPLAPTNTFIDKVEDKLNRNSIGRKMVKGMHTDPTQQSKLTNAKEWASIMGTGSLVSHLPLITSGDFITPAALAVGNAAKGAAIGPLLSKGDDSLLRSAAIPAGIVAITTPLLNSAGAALDVGDHIDFQPEARVGLTAALGSGMWAMRNRKNKNRIYI